MWLVLTRQSGPHTPANSGSRLTHFISNTVAYNPPKRYRRAANTMTHMMPSTSDRRTHHSSEMKLRGLPIMMFENALYRSHPLETHRAKDRQKFVQLLVRDRVLSVAYTKWIGRIQPGICMACITHASCIGSRPSQNATDKYCYPALLIPSTIAYVPFLKMLSEKNFVETIVHDDISNPGDGNGQDRVDMQRLGRKQELLRTFRFFSVLAFVVILQSTWEGVLLTSQLSYGGGGLAGSIYLFIGVWFGMLAVIASIAEMASMAPTAGGQYHYVSELAPRNMQAFLSYLVAWFSCLGWVAGIPAVALQACALVQQMVLINYPDVDVEELWQATLMAMAFMFLAFFFNFFLSRRLALAESMILVVHVLAFIIFIAIFWAMSPHTDAATVFTSTYNGAGWSTQGLSVLVGIVAPLWCLAGSDCGAHMSEELEDASLQLPRAMMWAVTFNGLTGLIMLITFCFCITDLEDLLSNDSTMPVVQILYAATQSTAGTLFLCAILLVLAFFGLLTTVATTSRQIWAFARDRGLPFSNWMHKVSIRWNVPFNALLTSLAISFILLCINFGSDVALNAILSVSNAALLFTYIIAIGCVRLKRLRSQPLLPRRWSLGRWGGTINDLALAFLAVAFVFSFFPGYPSVGDDAWAADFNWAIVIFAAWMVISVGLWYVGGARHKYVPPVMLVKRVEVMQ